MNYLENKNQNRPCQNTIGTSREDNAWPGQRTVQLDGQNKPVDTQVRQYSGKHSFVGGTHRLSRRVHLRISTGIFGLSNSLGPALVIISIVYLGLHKILAQTLP